MANEVFNRVWAPMYESTTNIVGDAYEIGARAVFKQSFKKEEKLKKYASNPLLDTRSEGIRKEAAFNEAFNAPGASFKRLSFVMTGPLKDRSDYVSKH